MIHGKGQDHYEELQGAFEIEMILFRNKAHPIRARAKKIERICLSIHEYMWKSTGSKSDLNPFLK